MYYVEVYRSGRNGQEFVGYIVFNGAHLYASPPDSPLLTTMLSEPVIVGRRTIFPNANPLDWLANLTLKYAQASRISVSSMMTSQTTSAAPA